MNIFTILDDILVKKTKTLYEESWFESVFSKYVITRYISMDVSLSSYAEACNLLGPYWSNKQMYLFLVNSIPKRKSSFIKYIKKDIPAPTPEN